MARILILHPNFPAQFRQQASRWGLNHDVRFLCQTHYGRTLPGVQRLCLKGKASHQTLEENRRDQLSRSLLMGEQYQSGFRELLKGGWQPDVVLSHSGWGCGLHSAVAFPEARRIAYVEWWFGSTDNSLVLETSGQRQRNLPLALELSESDLIVAPTQWQRLQLPTKLRERCQVIHDGVDVEWFSPDPTQRDPQPPLTYGTRGMEATRHFPELIRALPAALSRWPQLRVEIAGEDRICYGGSPPAGFSSYGNWAKALLAEWIDADRVRFLGTLKPKDYRAWLRRSWVHQYLTKPFVASWSLLEAMACGCTILANPSEPVLEFAGGGDSVAFVGSLDGELWLKRALGPLLSSADRRKALALQARHRAEALDSASAGRAWDMAAGLQTNTHQVDPSKPVPVLSERFAPVLQPTNR